ncbi:hypothetical protein EYF80_059613 [Liparis tanakae]|uniref:Uncharacterized protein n=1 Tax=Liparis tanakae TaxID=230148 RepID=A0A4Z2ENB4_9TELE|nr:hypothetical protein EYF80_059613 [Liparis tanakae]
MATSDGRKFITALALSVRSPGATPGAQRHAGSPTACWEPNGMLGAQPEGKHPEQLTHNTHTEYTSENT